ncbi:addiction module toxin, HicA family [Phormidesmis priestleyi ULC007]|uniref:Addiction module toxin, HicA family n=1 Tax=Phormidesmis priestleyi ULC007 TaxID=1920490 RepID=A0A2T1D7Q6_9CYAN|nr:type II toxin-antitoxin system HicA family toxin [Phormidesmis priestleyi]PSB16542.1 addiction module toxin, HicA family [Phormidesmis priestleyi ULC007]PZO47395.1 MAG: addiction module toxin, HicA family [Phormidesmis priestleyi]
MSRTRRMNTNEVEKILQRYGFVLISQKGSHRKWRNLEPQLQVTENLLKVRFTEQRIKR